MTATYGSSDALDEQQLLRDAEAVTGLSDWGADESFRIGLGVLTQAVNDMQVPGVTAIARARISEILATRLRLEDDAKHHPEILSGVIERPLVIMGLPRTGTTVLYDLLALDPSARWPREWEFQWPWPAPETATFHSDPRIETLESQYREFRKLAPNLASIQRFGAELPSECNVALTHHFATTQFSSEWSVPAYAQWLRRSHSPNVYRTHKRILQQLQWKGPRGRWLIKSPEHLYHLEGLQETYPDACMVWTHRDPVLAISSLASLVTQLRRLMGAGNDPAANGRAVLETWATGIERAMRSRDNPQIDRAILDIPHREVVKDKVAVVKKIYAHFDLPFNAEHEAKLRGGEAEKASDRLGRHQHKPEDFGLDRDLIRERLASYYQRFSDMHGGY